MRKCLLSIFLMCLCAVCAQAAEPADSLVMPKFRGGSQLVFTRWVLQNLQFPNVYYDAGVEVYALVNFTITKKGVVKYVEVLGSVEKPYADELMRVISSSENWSPHLVNGKPTEWKWMLPFNFRLSKAVAGDGTIKLMNEDLTPYSAADPMPMFNGGGPREFRAWVLSKLGQLKLDTALRIRVGGVVERDGAMTYLKVGIPRGKDPFLRDAIESRLTDVPAWTPGVLEGDTVRVRLMVEMSANPDSEAADFVIKGRRGTPRVEDAYLLVEQMPTFLGRDLSAFRQWVTQNVRFPVSCLQRGVSGRVLVSVIVERDGRLTVDRVFESPDSELTEAVLTVLARSPRWKPGRQDGETVRVKYMLPVDFRTQAPPHSLGYSQPSSR